MKKKAWQWVCEFCFRTTNEDPLPLGWDWVWQSAVCPKCKVKVAEHGGYNVVRGGAFAGKRVDPRSLRERRKQRRIRKTLQSLGRQQ
jgi:hypothetical protein